MIVQMKQSFSRNMYKMTLFVTPIFSTIMLGEMYKNSSAENFMSYVVLGSGLFSFWSCIVFSSIGDIDRERWGATLPLIFVAPCSFRKILTGKILGNTVLSLITFLLTLVAAMVLYRQPIIINNVWLFIAAFMAMLICFVVVSLFFAYLLTLSRKTRTLMNCLDVPIALLCGFAFPVEILPLWVRFISYPLPITWAVKLLRLGVTGTNRVEFLTTLGLFAGTTAVFAVVAHALYLVIEDRVRKTASLEVA